MIGCLLFVLSLRAVPHKGWVRETCTGTERVSSIVKTAQSYPGAAGS